ncbi:MAG: pilus assembly protein CpaE [Acidobacteriota bacterium]|jgi:pilus assembly protein CpaE|nr:pilus assembly protein CpaE [Acidobacteriota bacterium]
MTQQLTFVILSTGLETFRELRGALSVQEGARLLAGGDDAQQMLPEIERLRPSAVVVALGSQPDADLRFVERVARECPQTAVICASRDSSPDVILRSMRAGAREFLRLPIRPDEFATVYKRTAEFCAVQPEAPKKRGRVISVFSSKGGTGTTFIAANVAAALRAPTVLMDLNLQAGDLGLFLGVEPKFSIADLIENHARVDDSLLRSYLTPHSENLSLLAAPREADSADDIEAEHIFQVLEILRERHEYVVVDPQHTFDPITLAALDQSDEILLVLTLDIPAIRSTQRALEIFDRLGYPRHKLHVVVNRFSKQIDLDLRQVERFLGERVMGYVQSDYRMAVNSINLGQPLVDSEPQSKIATELRQIAARFGSNVAAAPAGGTRRGLLGSFLRREKTVAKEAVGKQLSAVS